MPSYYNSYSGFEWERPGTPWGMDFYLTAQLTPAVVGSEVGRECIPFGANEVRGDLGWGFLGGAIWETRTPTPHPPQCEGSPWKHVAAGLFLRGYPALVGSSFH